MTPIRRLLAPRRWQAAASTLVTLAIGRNAPTIALWTDHYQQPEWFPSQDIRASPSNLSELDVQQGQERRTARFSTYDAAPASQADFRRMHGDPLCASLCRRSKFV